jgi:hypothetical protein
MLHDKTWHEHQRHLTLLNLQKKSWYYQTDVMETGDIWVHETVELAVTKTSRTHSQYHFTFRSDNVN